MPTVRRFLFLIPTVILIALLFVFMVRDMIQIFVPHDPHNRTNDMVLHLGMAVLGFSAMVALFAYCVRNR